MKTSKLVVGIISIVLCFLVGLQSCAAGLGNALENNGEIGGTAGLILAISLLIACIVAICTRNGGKGGYVSTAFYVLAGLIRPALRGQLQRFEHVVCRQPDLRRHLCHRYPEAEINA